MFHGDSSPILPRGVASVSTSSSALYTSAGISHDAGSAGEAPLRCGLKRELFIPFLIRRLNDEGMVAAQWVNKDDLIFKIKWIHMKNGKYDFDDHSRLFKEWAQNTRKYERHRDGPSYWKINFRSALNVKKGKIIELFLDERGGFTETDKSGDSVPHKNHVRYFRFERKAYDRYIMMMNDIEQRQIDTSHGTPALVDIQQSCPSPDFKVEDRNSDGAERSETTRERLRHPVMEGSQDYMAGDDMPYLISREDIQAVSPFSTPPSSHRRNRAQHPSSFRETNWKRSSAFKPYARSHSNSSRQEPFATPSSLHDVPSHCVKRPESLPNIESYTSNEQLRGEVRTLMVALEAAQRQAETTSQSYAEALDTIASLHRRVAELEVELNDARRTVSMQLPALVSRPVDEAITQTDGSADKASRRSVLR